MTCPHTVGDPPVPFDTPGIFNPDETTPQRKSYAAALLTEAARPKSGPLGLNNAAWPPLASMADPPPKQFVLAKDRVPPDRPKPKNKRRRRPRTRRHRKRQTHDNLPNKSSIKSETDLIAVLSSFVQQIQAQSLVELQELFAARIKSIQNEIIANLKNALRSAIKKLRTKLRAEIQSLQQPLREKQDKHKTRRKQDTIKIEFKRPPRKHKSDYVLKTSISTEDDGSIFSDTDDESLHSTGKCNNQNATDSEGNDSSSSELYTHEQQEKLEFFSEKFDPRVEGLVATSPRNHGVVERGPQLVPNFFDCHVIDRDIASHEQYSDGIDDGGASDGGWSASGASAQADY